MKTRAAIYVEHEKPLVIDEIDLPDLGPDDVYVKQIAAGVCHSQLHQIHNPRQNKPVVLGHESTGVISGVGKNVTYVKEGDRVMVAWMPRTVGGPRPRQPSFTYKGQEAMSGGGNTSSWADTTCIHEQFVVKLEDGVDPEATAIIGCAVMTGAGAALNTAGVRAGDSVAIFGVGGVGLSTVAACANAGCYPIIVIDLRDDKLEFAKQFGATHFINATKVEPAAPAPQGSFGALGPIDPVVGKIRELTGGVGVDYSFDAIGAQKTLEQFWQPVRVGGPGRKGGTAVLIGVPTGPIPFSFGVRNRYVTGDLGGASDPVRDFPMYVRWFKEGKFPLDRLVSRRYKLEQINEALSDLERGEIAGRSIVTFD
jgi:Zn-dependent alcohol dehydrogenase